MTSDEGRWLAPRTLVEDLRVGDVVVWGGPEGNVFAILEIAKELLSKRGFVFFRMGNGLVYKAYYERSSRVCRLSSREEDGW